MPSTSGLIRMGFRAPSIRSATSDPFKQTGSSQGSHAGFGGEQWADWPTACLARDFQRGDAEDDVEGNAVDGYCVVDFDVDFGWYLVVLGADIAFQLA